MVMLKKKILYSLVLVLALSPFVTAGENLFLPYEHKAYDDLAELARAGLLPSSQWEYITEYQKSLTRYEIAFYLKNLILRLEENPSPALTGKQEYILKDLIKEFERELTSLGVDVTYLDRVFPVDFSSSPELNDGYQDLDIILNPKNNFPTGKEENKKIVPHYFIGQYYTGMLDWEYFIFFPENSSPNRPENSKQEVWEIIYQKENRNAFLVIEGELPHGKKEIQGYYLFPLAEFANKESEQAGVEKAYTLLQNLSGSYWVNIDSVQRLEGEWSLDNFHQVNDPLPGSSILMDGIETGIQIGDLVLSTRLMKERTGTPPVLEEQPEEGTALSSSNSYVSTETIEEESIILNHWHVDLQGSVFFHENTLVYGGLRWEYEQAGDYLRQLSLVNSLINAGVSFKINDYLQMLVDYKWYNDFTEGENISQTSLGLGWGDNTLLTLRYRMLSLEPPSISGEVSFKF